MSGLVDVEGLSLRYGSVRALDGVDFTLHHGITGLLGPNGAGKTTLLRCLSTVLVPDAGRMDILGYDPDSPVERIEIRRRVGYMPQEPGFYASFSCFDFLDYVAILKDHVDPDARHREVRRVIELVGLEEKAKTKIRRVSGGMRRRLALAQSLIGSPRLLLFDEPTAGLDPEQRFRFRELVSDLSEDRVVLLSTHQTEDVAAVCDRVLVMADGHIRFDGSPTELAQLATGQVWLTTDKPSAAQVYWRTADGTFRGVGQAPPGSSTIEPTIEDGYLLLVGAAALAEAAA